jgi:hypothetical protein
VLQIIHQHLLFYLQQILYNLNLVFNSNFSFVVKSPAISIAFLAIITSWSACDFLSSKFLVSTAAA